MSGRLAGAGAGALLAAYALWSHVGRGALPGVQELRLAEVVVSGEDRGAGNLLGIQPYMVPADFASEEVLFRKLDGYMTEAGRRGLLGRKTVAVFPEYLGTWLVAAGEKRGVYAAPTAHAALRLVVGSNLLSFLRRLPFPHGRDAVKEAVFRMKAPAMAAAYQGAFGRLAREHGVTIVAGSILLPEPRVEGGRLLLGSGPLQNVSAVFRPDGRLYDALVRKAFPIEEEKPFVAAAPVESLPVFDSPAGRLGVLICADSWHPEAYRVLRAKGVDVIVVPSYAAGSDVWSRPWRGYNGVPMPEDADAADVGRLTEAEAWDKYALTGRLASAGATAGINVFLRGDLWDLGDDGQSCAVARGVSKGPHVDGAVLLSQWLPPR